MIQQLMYGVRLPEYPGYIAFADGSIRGSSGRTLKLRFQRGYHLVHLSRDGRTSDLRVNRLICEAFHGAPPSPIHQAAHLNGHRADNRASNLAWKTQAENEADKILHGTQSSRCVPRGESSSISKLTDELVREMRQLYSEGCHSHRDLARRFGVSKSTVGQVMTRERWSHVK